MYFIIFSFIMQLGLICQSYLFPWSLDIAIFFAFSILYGTSFKNFYFHEKRKSIFFIVLLIYGLLVYINGNINLSVRAFGKFQGVSLILSFFTGVVYTFILSYICRQFEQNIFIRILARIGNKSLRLMCIHLPIMIIVSKFLWHLHIIDLNCVLLLMIQLIIIGLITILIQLIVDRFSSYFSILNYI